MSPDPAAVPEDRTLSPHTGWHRGHWEAVADRLLLAPRRYATPGRAQFRLPGPVSSSGAWSDGLEGYARTFLLAAFRLAGAGGTDPLHLAGWYAEGLAAGVDPESPERWPTLREIRQARVEAASIALALHETRPWIWDRLSDRTRAQTVDWLAGIVGTHDYANNWVWFQNIIEAFLRTVGGPWLPADITRNLERHESWYLGDGWYTDGGTRNFDYYAWWAMHLYPLWYGRILSAAEDPDLAATYRGRLRTFLADAPFLVAADGASVLQGRSATYRFGMLAPYWAGAIFDASPLPPGLTRRVASGVLRYFLRHGAVDAEGLLPIGWHGAFPSVRQPYSGAGSPYWASKGLAGLLLSPDHPVWTEPESPLPVETGDTRRLLRQPGWIVSGTRADGVVRVINHGTDHARGDAAATDSPWYARHGYATHTAPDLPPAEPWDNHVALLDESGRPSHRTPLRRVDIGAAGMASASRVHWPDDGAAEQDTSTEHTGPWLTTASVVRGPIEVRLARVDVAAGPQPDRLPWRLHVGGWPVAAATPPSRSISADTATVTRADGLTSTVIALHHLDDCGAETATGANPLGSHSTTPWTRTTSGVRPGVIHAAVVILSADPRALTEAPQVRLTTTADTATVTWADGTRDRVPLPPPPLP